jgi:cell division GTPase FtsZ
MFGFLGLGAAGGNIADEAAKNGFAAAAINYSQKDLDSLEYVEERLKLVGSEGVGKNREEAIRLISKNWESALTFVKENFSSPSIEVIVVCFSTSGGSGSGIAPVLLEIMMEELDEKAFIAAPILPDFSEAIGNQMNCIKASEELSHLDICVLPIDNEQTRKQYPSYGKNKIYEVTNQQFIAALTHVLEYTERESKNGVLDRKDLLAILKTKGTGVIAKTDLTKMSKGSVDLSINGITDMVTESWWNSVFAPIEIGRIIRAGFIFDGQESLIENIKLNRIFSAFTNGMPWDLFEGYYESEANKIYTIVTGLPWYKTRLRKIEAMIQEKEKAAQETIQQDDTYESKLSLNSKKKEAPAKKKSALDIISRYRR